MTGVLGSYLFNVLVRNVYGYDITRLSISCVVIKWFGVGDHLELWLSCSDVPSVIRSLERIFNDVGPVILVGFLDGSITTLPNFLVNIERSSNYLTLNGEVWIECLDERCGGKVLELLKTPNLSRINWYVRDNKLRIVTKDLSTKTTYHLGLRIIKPKAIPPKLLKHQKEVKTKKENHQPPTPKTP
jgi:hypothetical protein